MIEVKRDDFFVESIKNPIEYGTYYKINPKYGTGFQWTSEVHHDFIITATDIRFNQETMVGEHIGSGYVLALYISGAGDEFYPYQNISPNTLRCYEPSEKYKAIYHPQIRFLYKGIIIKHNKTEPTYTKTSLFLCEKRRFFMARTEKGVVATI